MARRERADAAATADSPLGEVLDFMKLLWAVDHGLQRTSKRMAASLGVTGPQRLVLRVVARYPGIAAGQLAAILRLHPSTVTVIVQRLEQEGLLTRGIDKKDRRRTQLKLTDRGRRLARNPAGTVEEAMQAALAGISEKALAAASEVLAVVAAELERSARGRTEPGGATDQSSD